MLLPNLFTQWSYQHERDTDKRKDASRHQTHGLTTLKRAVNKLGSRAIARRTSLGKALDQWRGQLVADLDGRDMISTQDEPE